MSMADASLARSFQLVSGMRRGALRTDDLATAFSGYEPGHHDIFSYWDIHSPNGEKPRILKTQDLQVARFWDWSEVASVSFAVVNVQLMFPPPKLNGVVLSYLMNQTLRYSYPASLVHDLKKRGLPYGHDVSVFYRGEALDDFAERVFQVARYPLETAIALGAEHDMLIVNLTIVDRLSHFLWHEFDGDGPAEDMLMWRGYRFLDSALARLDCLAGDDPMLVFFEIGFGAIDGFEQLDHALARGGFQKSNRSQVNEGTAWRAREAVQGSHGILLDSDDQILADEVSDCLRAARNAQGKKLVRAATPREALFPGPAVARAPHLIVTPEDPRRPPMGDARWASHVNRHLQSGWHRDTGFLLGRRTRPLTETATLRCIAPTMAALLGRDAPEGCADPVAVRC